MQINVCKSAKDCRSEDRLCVNTVYPFDSSTLDVLVGMDALSAGRMIMKYDGSETSVGLSVNIGVYGDKVRVILIFALLIGAIIWLPMPYSFEISSSVIRLRMRNASILSISFIMFVVSYVVKNGIVSNISRTSEVSYVFSLFFAIMIIEACIVHSIFLVYIQLSSSSANSKYAFRIFFSALLCESIMLISVGSSEQDFETMIAAGAAMVYLVCIPITILESQTQNSLAMLSTLVLPLPTVVFVCIRSALDFLSVYYPEYASVVISILLINLGVLVPVYNQITTSGITVWRVKGF